MTVNSDLVPSTTLVVPRGLLAAAVLLKSASNAIAAAGAALAVQEQPIMLPATLCAQCLELTRSLKTIALHYMHNAEECPSGALGPATGDLLSALARCQQRAQTLQLNCRAISAAPAGSPAPSAAAAAAEAPGEQPRSTQQQWWCFFLVLSAPAAIAWAAVAAGACFFRAPSRLGRLLGGVVAGVAGGLAGLLQLRRRRARAAAAQQQARRQAALERPLRTFLSSMGGLCSCIAEVEGDISSLPFAAGGAQAQAQSAVGGAPARAQALRAHYRLQEGHAQALLQASKECCSRIQTYQATCTSLTREVRMVPTAAAAAPAYA